MLWPFSTKTISSERNGKIAVMRFFKWWEVTVDGYHETTPYLHAMWQGAFTQCIPQDFTAKNVLMLGLGAGGEISTIHERFPKCTLTVVEWDPKMIELAQEAKLYKPHPFPTVLTGDAKEIYPTLTGPYDLIIWDMFVGPEPSLLVTNQTYINKTKELLSLGGLFIVNAFNKTEYLAAAQAEFPSHIFWTYKFNTLGVFTHDRTS
jgi:spermidine synthase